VILSIRKREREGPEGRESRAFLDFHALECGEVWKRLGQRGKRSLVEKIDQYRAGEEEKKISIAEEENKSAVITSKPGFLT